MLDRKPESFRHDPDDRRLRAAQPNDVTQHQGIATETGLPKSVPKDHYCRRSWIFIGFLQSASYQCGNAGDPKGSGADLGGRNGLADFLSYDEVPLDQPKGPEVLNSAETIAPSDKIIGRCGPLGGFHTVPIIEPHNTFAFGERKTRVSHPIDDLKRARADTDRDGHRQASDDR
jgi:hypothetical protein